MFSGLCIHIELNIINDVELLLIPLLNILKQSPSDCFMVVDLSNRAVSLVLVEMCCFLQVLTLVMPDGRNVAEDVPVLTAQSSPT